MIQAPLQPTRLKRAASEAPPQLMYQKVKNMILSEPITGRHSAWVWNVVGVGLITCPGVVPRTMCDRSSVCGKPAIVALWYVRTRGTNAGLVVELFMVTAKGHGKSEEDFMEIRSFSKCGQSSVKRSALLAQKDSWGFLLAVFQR